MTTISNVEAYAETRIKFPHLTNDEFIELAATNLVTEKLIPVLQDALGLSGYQAKDAIFKVTVTAEDLAKNIVSDIISLQESTSGE